MSSSSLGQQLLPFPTFPIAARPVITDAQDLLDLVHNLSHRLQYQAAIRDIVEVVRPAEGRYLSLQAELELAAVQIFHQYGVRVEAFLTDYARASASHVGTAYSELVEYLMLRYLVGDAEFARPTLPRIAAPSLPERAGADTAAE